MVIGVVTYSVWSMLFFDVIKLYTHTHTHISISIVYSKFCNCYSATILCSMISLSWNSSCSEYTKVLTS